LIAVAFLFFHSFLLQIQFQIFSDAYEMNGKMQESYSHCIPKKTDSGTNPNDDKTQKAQGSDTGMNATTNNEEHNTSRTSTKRRICVVLRTGQQRYFKKDTGIACNDLSPRKPIVYKIGDIPNLNEGSLYTRRRLQDLGAFQVSFKLSCYIILFFSSR